jgi:hypothetical protein
VADAAEAKHLADAQLLEAAAGTPTLAPGGTSTSTTFFSNIDDGKKSAIASGGMSVSRIPAES